MGDDHARRGDAGADRRLPRRAALQGRDRGRDRGLRGGDARARARREAEARATSSTPPAPAATTPTRSTSRPPPRSSRPPQAPASRSTATAPSSSSSGSADVLEALGFELELPPERIEQSIDELGFGFLFAPTHHPAMRHAAPVRRELATRTVFNVLGPLTNPAGARAQVVGVFSPDLVPTLAEVLAQLGARRAFVVHGADGIDELSPAGPNLVARSCDGSVVERTIDPLDLGVPRCAPAELRGGTPAENAAAIREVFAGADGGARDAILLNAAGAIAAGGPRGGPARGARGRPQGARLAAQPASGSTRSWRSRGAMGALATRCARRGSARSPRSSGARPRRATSARTPTRPSSRRVRARRRGRGLGARRRALRRLARRPQRARARRARAPLLAKGFFREELNSCSCKLAGADAALLLLRDLDDARVRALPATRPSSDSTRSSRRTTRRSSTARSRSTRR